MQLVFKKAITIYFNNYNIMKKDIYAVKSDNNNIIKYFIVDNNYLSAERVKKEFGYIPKVAIKLDLQKDIEIIKNTKLKKHFNINIKEFNIIDTYALQPKEHFIIKRNIRDGEKDYFSYTMNFNSINYGDADKLISTLFE